MILCLCGCPDIDHAIGEGICDRCGCPAYRPVRVGTEAEDDLHDLANQDAVDGMIAEHTLTSDVRLWGDHGIVTIELPELPTQ